MDAMSINVRSIARREQKNGNTELAAVLDGLAIAIEKQRGDIERLMSDILEIEWQKDELREYYLGELDKKDAEIDRLRAALLSAGKRVREANDETSRACIADAVDAIARRALEGNERKEDEDGKVA